VDINPGDRAVECGGMMKPVEVLAKGDSFVILHRCQKCGFERKNKTGEKDSFNVLYKI
jgi:hypothetical protein